MLRELDDELTGLDPAFAARPNALNALNGNAAAPARRPPADAGGRRDRQDPGGGRGTRPASAGVARDDSQVEIESIREMLARAADTRHSN